MNLIIRCKLLSFFVLKNIVKVLTLIIENLVGVVKEFIFVVIYIKRCLECSFLDFWTVEYSFERVWARYLII